MAVVDASAICLFSLERSLGIHCFRPSWPSWSVFAIRAKFVDYCPVIICIFFTLCTTKGFSCSCSITTQLKLIKRKFPNYTMLHVHQYSLKFTHSKAMHNIPPSMILPTTVATIYRLNGFIHMKCAANKQVPKYCLPSWVGL